MVFGLPGSGKSTLAQRLSQRIGATWLSSDVLRAERGLQGDYRMESITAVYDEMMDRARQSLELAHSVVLDGSFSNRRFREQANELVREADVNLLLIHMVADEATTLRRVGRKRKLSEAGPEAYALLKDRFQPVEGEHLRLDSSRTTLKQLLTKAVDYVSATAVK